MGSSYTDDWNRTASRRLRRRSGKPLAFRNARHALEAHVYSDLVLDAHTSMTTCLGMLTMNLPPFLRRTQRFTNVPVFQPLATPPTDDVKLAHSLQLGGWQGHCEVPHKVGLCVRVDICCHDTPLADVIDREMAIAVTHKHVPHSLGQQKIDSHAHLFEISTQ